MAICKDIEIISKVLYSSPKNVKLNREILNTDHIDDVKLSPPQDCKRHLFEHKRGTKVILSNFDKTHWTRIDLIELKKEIETHFELLLSRSNIRINIFSNDTKFSECTTFNYNKYEGDYYCEDVAKLTTKIRGDAEKTFNITNPLKVYIKITKGEDINKRPVVISKGRRITELKDLRSFKSKNKQTIWNHPNVTGYIDIQDFLDPTIARNDFRNNDKSKALFSYLINIESLVQDLIEKINKAYEERHYQQLEDALNKALSDLAKLDISTLKYRTDIITGKEISLMDGALGQDLTEGLGGKDRGNGTSGSGAGIGENEGGGVGPGDMSGDLPSNKLSGDSPQKKRIRKSL